MSNKSHMTEILCLICLSKKKLSHQDRGCDINMKLKNNPLYLNIFYIIFKQIKRKKIEGLIQKDTRYINIIVTKTSFK